MNGSPGQNGVAHTHTAALLLGRAVSSDGEPLRSPQLEHLSSSPVTHQRVRAVSRAIDATFTFESGPGLGTWIVVTWPGRRA